MKWLLLAIVYVGLTAYAFVDAVQHEDREPYGLPRAAWVSLIILVPFVGAIAWMVARFRGPASGGVARRGPRPPDDDPEYLEWLEREGRRRRRNKGEKGG